MPSLYAEYLSERTNDKIIETKLCTKCKESKDLQNFSKSATCAGGLNTICKECVKTSRKPEVSSRYGLKKAYGITIEQKQLMVNAQNGKCACCPTLFKKLSDAQVDHDHKTGRIRGILCRPCNLAIGLLKEDNYRIESVKNYLTKFGDIILTQAPSMYAQYKKERENIDTLEIPEGYATYLIKEKECYIQDIFVRAEHRNKDFASLMANRIAEIAKLAGCTILLGSVCLSARGSDSNMKVLLAYGMKPYATVNDGVFFKKELESRVAILVL